jgi:hypothetical protein
MIVFKMSEEAVEHNEDKIREDDVLLGRGGATNNHPGNQKFRAIVAEHQIEYLQARKKEKVVIARRIVAIVHKNGGRFLKRSPDAETWEQVTDKRAQEKTSQALREGLDVRHHKIRVAKRPREAHSDSEVHSSRKKLKSVAGKVTAPCSPETPGLESVTPGYDALQQARIADFGGRSIYIPDLGAAPAPAFMHYQPPPLDQNEVERQCGV